MEEDREIPTKEMTLKLNPESTERANLTVNWENSLHGSHKAKTLSRNELLYVRNIKKARLEGEVRKQVKVETQGLLASISLEEILCYFYGKLEKGFFGTEISLCHKLVWN